MAQMNWQERSREDNPGYRRESGGKGQQGLAKQASRAGRCVVCAREYKRGTKIIDLGGRQHAHADCAFSEVTVRKA